MRLHGEDPVQLEEERRLCYVGMTRAKLHLYLVRAFRRPFSGHNPPSRFLSDIPPQLVKHSQRASQRELFGPARYRVALPREEDARQQVSGDKFKPGDHVKHERFGEGVVVSCEPSGGDYQVIVAFQGEAGIKKLLLSFAPLEKIG